MFKFFKILKYSGLLMLLFSGLVCDAQQSWLPGYRYRKKITINKTKVENNATAPHWSDFYVLVELEEPGLRHLENAFENKITHPEGLDIAFSNAVSPLAALKFQLVSYNAQTGKLVCWVLIDKLYTKTSTIENTNSFYFLYGSAVLHQPHDPVVESMWKGGYYHVQHFNEAAEGMIGAGKSFNGISDQKLVEPHTNTEYTLSAWIKLHELGRELMIMSNDSAGTGGYQLQVNKENRLVFIVNRGPSVRTFTGSSVLKMNEWNFVSTSLTSTSLRILKNGASEYTNAALNFTAPLPAQVVIGASKTGNQFFNGIIDDLKISKIAKTTPRILTEYVNQVNPQSFYTVESEVANPNLAPYAHTFLGTKDNDYGFANNWSGITHPGNNKNIIIAAGRTAVLSSNVVINNLKLEAGAQINLTGQMQVLQTLELATGASISSTGLVGQLQLEGHVINNGNINLVGPQSRLLFSGNALNTNYTGVGAATVSLLEINRPAVGSIFTLSAPLQVMKSLNLINGALKANGHLVLLSYNGITAALRPVPSNATISGDVQVQSFVNGTFPSPATGRGWRLLSSPVIHTTVAGNGQYHLQAIKSSIFVTGRGGTANGFDASPNNGATIYTHNQSLPGTLAQKYVPIADMQVQIPVGKGFFVFSRGNRMLPNAYQQQIQSPPFVNAEPYILTYTGRLFTGDLTVEVFNNNKNGVGDGFNLVGNPYAAPIRWGSLDKINVGPFIWLFDPLNNTYRTSQDENELIQPGEGFFIKVNEGATSGSISFNERSKVVL
ncbi:LamG domain-containing protein [Pedobacter immunditicola]|uniref:LamG domain-containing protein n=1 Tax=Pedobacter immunditicola TaxID=3133440 RepID=UPI0030AB4EDB